MQIDSAELGGILSVNVALVFGTRPEAIKLAPVAGALAALGLVPRLILTGQHRELSITEFGFSGFPLIQLNCPGMEDPHRHVGLVERAVSGIVQGTDLIVVQGDTSSAMGGALAAATRGIPLAHVEAGLRTFDPSEPWPEEEYRTAIDAHSDLLFAPTEVSAANLRKEAVNGSIYVTGNTGIDALLRIAGQLPAPAPRQSGLPRLLVTCHRRENWGERLDGVVSALTRLAADGAARVDMVLPPNQSVAAALISRLDQKAGIRLFEPRTHRQLLKMMRESDLILSDSGGMQEEAPAFGIPLLVLRDKTERPEGLASGNMELVGTDSDKIFNAVSRLITDPMAKAAMSRPAFPYGDGHSAPRIAAIIEQWLEDRNLVLRRA